MGCDTPKREMNDADADIARLTRELQHARERLHNAHRKLLDCMKKGAYRLGGPAKCPCGRKKPRRTRRRGRR